MKHAQHLGNSNTGNLPMSCLRS